MKQSLYKNTSCEGPVGEYTLNTGAPYRVKQQKKKKIPLPTSKELICYYIYLTISLLKTSGSSKGKELYLDHPVK